MKRLTLLLFFGSFFGLVQGQDFKVEDVIHPIVAKLPAPELVPGFAKGLMAVSTSSDEAAKHVAQGMAQLNTSWDFEAYRHFCEAVKLDPDCLMAYWGITMSLAGSQHEYFKERQKAIDRMLDLMEWAQKEGVEKWTELERGYAQAAGRLLTEGIYAAGDTFRLVAARFPNDVHSRLFAEFLTRDGFDDFGEPKAGQRQASEAIFKILEAHPEDLSVMSFWVASQTEGPLKGPQLRKDVLPIARKLVRLHPEYAPFYLLLTHSESHCGNAALAIEAAEKAVVLYDKYMAEHKVSVFDCEGWVRAKVYLVNLYETKGNHAKALEIARELGKIEIDKDRVFSRGAGFLLWEGRTAGARVMMGRANKASFYEGQKMLEVLPEAQWFKDHSFALYYRDCLAFYLGIRVAVSVKDLENGKALYTKFVERVRALEMRREVAQKTSSYSSWLRATRTLGLASYELKGMLTALEREPIKSTAVNWFRGGVDRQNWSSNLLPPSIDYPMELRLGDFYMSQGKTEEAGKEYRKGLKIRPNHLATLKGYQRALAKLGKAESAAILAKRIEDVSR